jgi:hypothetical protein
MIIKIKTEAYPPEPSLHVKPYSIKGKLNKKCILNQFPRESNTTRNE